MVRRRHELGVAAVQGVTPRGVEQARRSGAPLVKLFSGSLGGRDYVRALLATLAAVVALDRERTWS